jgi:hypothetical protein
MRTLNSRVSLRAEIIGAHARGKDVGEEACEQGAQEGEAGTDNADVDFDGTPGCGGGVVVGWV